MATAKKNPAEKSAKNTAPSNEQKPVEAVAIQTNWLVERINKRTGEIERVDKYKYLEGNPKQYRSDSKAGCFNLNGGASIGEEFSFQPIAWRLFEDDILNSGLKRWFEVFFIDEKSCLSAIIFHGYSVENLLNMAAPLFYDEITLADVVITAKHVMHESKSKEAKKAKFSIVEFTYKEAESKLVEELDAYCQQHKVYRRATLTANANFESVYNYYNPLEEEHQEMEEQEVVQG